MEKITVCVSSKFIRGTFLFLAMPPPTSSRRRALLRAIAPLAAIILVLFFSPLVSAGPREDREAAAAAAAAEKAAASSPAPLPSASSALGSGAPKNASFLFTITARKAELSPDPKVSMERDECGERGN